MKPTPNKTIKILSLVLLFATLLAACGQKPAGSSTPLNFRREGPKDICFSAHAASYIALFVEDYPDMQLTKLRWQVLPSGAETYVIEGNNGQSKSIVKYLLSNSMVLGRVQRAFTQEELAEDGSCIEKQLDFNSLLTFTEICDIAAGQLAGKIHEVRLVHRGNTPTVYIEAVDANLRPEGIFLNARTGETLF